MLDCNFLVFVEEAEFVCALEETEIFETKKVTLVVIAVTTEYPSRLCLTCTFTARRLPVQFRCQAAEGAHREGIPPSFMIGKCSSSLSQILGSRHYFSFGEPLTMSLQQRAKNPSILLDERFMWNHSMMMPLIKQGVSLPWHLQLIQGYIGSFTSTIKKGLAVKYFLISRRSVHRSGTRCNHRGK